MVFNASVISSIAVSGTLSRGKISTCDPAVLVNIEFQPLLVHWSSALSIYINTAYPLNQFCDANITLKIETEFGESETTISLFFQLAASTRKDKRILWDLSHSVKYPEGGKILRDEDKGGYMFDWRGDHPLTNYLGLYTELLNQGYIVDFSNVDFKCVDADMYSVYLILDPEAEFTENETDKIKFDVEKKGVSLLILADWYDEVKVSKNLEQKSSQILARDQTNATTAGSAIPALNELLSSYFIELSTSDTFSGTIAINEHTADYLLGTAITRFPHGGFLLTQYLQSSRTKKYQDIPILGLYDDTSSGNLKGRIALFGDSSCFDKELTSRNCLWLLDPLLSFLRFGEVDPMYFPASSKLPDDYDLHKEMDLRIPRTWRTNFNASSFCRVIPHEAQNSYHHNKSINKLQIWVSSPEEAKKRESQWLVYVQRGVFVGFGVLAILVWLSGKRRRDVDTDVLPKVDRHRKQRRLEECGLVTSRRCKSKINTLPIDIEL